MMVKSGLDVFAGMSNEKILKLGDFIDNDVIGKIPDPIKMHKILGNNITDEDMEGLMRVFCDFIMSKKDPNKIFRMIEESKLPIDKIKTLKRIVQNIHDGTSLNKTVIASNFLKTLGDFYTHKFIIMNEPERDIDEEAFEEFLKKHLKDPKYAGKYVAFVHGKFQKYGSDEMALIKEMHNKFGNVDMHVSKITSEKQIITMPTPKFL